MSQATIDRPTPEEEISVNEEQNNLPKVHGIKDSSVASCLTAEEGYETYDALHAEMARLWNEADALPIASPERDVIVLQISELREQAYQAIPHKPCGPNSWFR